MSIRQDFERAIDNVAHVHAVIQLARDADAQFWSQEPPVDTEGVISSAKSALKKAKKAMTRKKTEKKKAKAAAKDASESDSDSGPDERTCKDKDGNTIRRSVFCHVPNRRID